MTVTPTITSPCHLVVVSSQRKPEQSDDDYTANNNNNNNNLGFMLTQPSPFLPSLPLGYPVALLFTSALLCSLPAAIFLHVTFVLFFLLGQQVSSYDNDTTNNNNNNTRHHDDKSSPVNLFALVAAVASAALLAPNELYVPTGDRLVGACATAGLALVCASVMMEQQAPDDGRSEDIDNVAPLELEALKEWDQKMADKETSRWGVYAGRQVTWGESTS